MIYFIVRPTLVSDRQLFLHLYPTELEDEYLKLNQHFNAMCQLSLNSVLAFKTCLNRNNTQNKLILLTFKPIDEHSWFIRKGFN